MPKKAKPPYQTVLFFPGSNALLLRKFAIYPTAALDGILRSGCAVIYPIYKSTYERGDGWETDVPDTSNNWRDHVAMWVKHASRALDYVNSRPRTFCSTHGQEGGTVGDIGDEFAHRAMDNFGAFILGRNMFGPVRGPWPDGFWRGWWGNNPPYHAPTFALPHHEREPLVMEGGTTFYFVTGGIDEALARPKKAAGSKDVKIGGGVSTVRQHLQAGLIDSVHLALVPVLLGQGEPLLHGLDLHALGFCVTDRKASEYATHFVLEKVAIES